MDKLSNVTSADLAGIYKEIAETVGIENTYNIYCHFKGMQMMFPLKFYSSEFIAQQLKESYLDGMSVHELVRKYGLSESRVRQILQEVKHKK